MTKCQLKEPPFYQCCCTCVFHKPDYGHPSTNGDSILVQRGWICEPPEFDDHRFSGWDEHSCGCEMHTTKEEYDKWRKPIRDYERRRHNLQMISLYFGLIFKRIIQLDWKNFLFSVERTSHFTKKFFMEW